jgi:tetratricopeptide (TPR) repeat protein
MIANAIQTQPGAPLRPNPSRFVALVLFFVLSLGLCALGQQSNTQSQPPAQSPTSDSKSTDSKSPAAKSKGQTQPADKSSDQKKSAAPNSTAGNSIYDPFHAQQDVEVGTFYMHKGDIDAAIPRFEDAIRLRANFAEPRLLLAKCYEKKHDPQKAIQYYREYLKVYPDAPDRKKVEKQIEKLSNE